MNLLLDTNVISKILRGKPESYRIAAELSLKSGDRHFTSSIVVQELHYGIAKSPNPEASRARVESMLLGLSGIIDFTMEDGEIAGRLRFLLARRGEVIGAYDMLIAAQALRMDIPVVTNNTREFARVPGLKIIDW